MFRIMSQSRFNSSILGSLRILNYEDNGGARIINVADPIDPQDSATKAYVDSSVSQSSSYAGIGLNLINHTFNVTPTQTQITAIGNINNGMWSASTILVPYGGTGCTNFAVNKLLVGNGTLPLSSASQLSYDSNYFTVGTPLIISNTTSATGTTNGSLNVLGSINTNTLFVSSNTVLNSLTVGNIYIAGNITLNTIISNTGYFTNITTSTLNASSVNVQNILTVPYITVNNLVGANITSSNCFISNITNGNLISNNHSTNNLSVTGISTLNNTSLNNMTGTNLLASNITVSNCNLTNISTSSLKTFSGVATNLVVTNASIGTLITNAFSSTNNYVTNITNSNSIITNLSNSNMVVNNSSISNLSVTNISGSTLSVIYSNSTYITSSNVLISNSLSVFGISSTNDSNVNLTSANANITTATIGSVTANAHSTFTDITLVNVTGNSLVMNNDINTGYLQAVQITSSNIIVSGISNLNVANVQSLSAGSVISNKCSFGSLTVTGNISNTGGMLSTSTINASAIVTSSLSSNNVTLSNLTQTGLANLSTVGANNITAYYLSCLNIYNTNISSTNAILTNISSSNLNVNIATLNNSSIVNNSVSNLVSTNLVSTNSSISNINLSSGTVGSLLVNSTATFQQNIQLFGDYQGMNSSSSGSFLTILPSYYTDATSTSVSSVNFWTANYISSPTLSALNPQVNTLKATNIFIEPVIVGANQNIQYNSNLSLGYNYNTTGGSPSYQIAFERSDSSNYAGLYVENSTNRFNIINSSLEGYGGIGLLSVNPITFASIPSSTNVSPATFASFSRQTSTFLSTTTSVSQTSGAVVIAGGLGVGNISTNFLTTSYSITTITEGSIYNFSSVNSGIVLVTNSTISNCSVSLPNIAVDGQNIYVCSTKAISNLTVGNTNIMHSTNFQSLRFVFIQSLGQWIQT